jgi:hypothetical protein
MPSYVTNDILIPETILLINRVIIGCTKLVNFLGAENQWKTEIRRSLKPSIEYLVTTLVIDLSKQDEERRFSPKDIEIRFSESVGNVHHSTITRSLRKLVSLNHLKIVKDNSRKRPGRPRASSTNTGRPGPKSEYSRSEAEVFLDNFVRTLFPRGMIYFSLYEAGVLSRLLKFFHYEQMISLKYSEIEQILKIEKAKAKHKVDSFGVIEPMCLSLQKDLKKKTDERIMIDASKLTKRDLRVRNWQNDRLYTTFFKTGGLCYAD